MRNAGERGLIETSGRNEWGSPDRSGTAPLARGGWRKEPRGMFGPSALPRSTRAAA